MNGWLLGGLGALAVAGVGWFIGGAGLAKVARSGTGALGDMAARGRVWLQTPGNPMRAMCGVLALLFLTAGLSSWKRGTQLAEQRAAYALLQERRDFEVERLQQGIEGRDRVIQQFIDLAERQKLLLDVMALQADRALSDAKDARDAAAASDRAYREAYDNRPAECEEALQQMARACPALGGY